MYDNMIKNPDYFKDKKGLTFTIFKNLPPSKYIDKCCKGTGVTRDELLSNREKARIDQYAQDMQNGHTFPMPIVDYTYGFSQEGLHRAFAAEINGIEKMPFMVIRKV